MRITITISVAIDEAAVAKRQAFARLHGHQIVSPHELVRNAALDSLRFLDIVDADEPIHDAISLVDDEHAAVLHTGRG